MLRYSVVHANEASAFAGSGSVSSIDARYVSSVVLSAGTSNTNSTLEQLAFHGQCQSGSHLAAVFATELEVREHGVDVVDPYGRYDGVVDGDRLFCSIDGLADQFLPRDEGVSSSATDSRELCGDAAVQANGADAVLQSELLVEVLDHLTGEGLEQEVAVVSVVMGTSGTSKGVYVQRAWGVSLCHGNGLS